MRGRTVALASSGAGVIAVVAIVLVWFQPQKLFLDDREDDPFPVAAVATEPSTLPTATTLAPTTATTASAAAVPGSTVTLATEATTAAGTTMPSEPVAERAGSFVSLDHGTSGTATIYLLSDGRRVLRIEDLDTSNGPDLFVYLTTNPADGEEGMFDDAYANLGRLQGNLGNQNYDIPAEVDVTGYSSVVIWCDRFDSAFGAADLA